MKWFTHALALGVGMMIGGIAIIIETGDELERAYDIMRHNERERNRILELRINQAKDELERRAPWLR